MNYHDELSKARAELAAVQDRLAKPEAEAKERTVAAKPWEPRGGGYALSDLGYISITAREAKCDIPQLKNAGSLYPTGESAESALPYVTFFKRLCCLAAQLNPSGKVGGGYWVFRGYTSGEWVAKDDSKGDYTSIFETPEAAQKATDILNRDSWKVPSIW